MWSSKLVYIAVMAVFLGAWEAVFKNVYMQAVQAEGGMWGFSTATLGYAIILTVGTVIAWIANRRLRRGPS